jgi:hypothetical protein
MFAFFSLALTSNMLSLSKKVANDSSELYLLIVPFARKLFSSISKAYF